MSKVFKLPGHAIKRIIHRGGACIATDMITVDGYPVRWMFREEPTHPPSPTTTRASSLFLMRVLEAHSKSPWIRIHLSR
jgi:hypothetical protein